MRNRDPESFDPGSEILDMEKLGSGIRDKYPGSATLGRGTVYGFVSLFCFSFFVSLFLFLERLNKM
jgi:hypothetical protein